MKRCPECEFIYEDDQSFCDMDGTKLAHDSRPLPKLQALSSTGDATAKARLRGRVVPVFASAILVIVLGLVYYVSTRQAVQNNVTSTAVEVPASTPVDSSAVPSATTAEQPSIETTTEAKRSDEEQTSVGSRKQKNTANARAANDTTRKAKNAQPKNSSEPSDKDDSKVRSMLKKTGRFFKKALPL